MGKQKQSSEADMLAAEAQMQINEKNRTANIFELNQKIFGTVQKSKPVVADIFPELVAGKVLPKPIVVETLPGSITVLIPDPLQTEI